MSDTVIRVENLSKKYVLNHQDEPGSYKSFRDVLSKGAKNLFSALTPPRRTELNSHQPSKEEFWALKDVSFEIKQGDRVGIIGRNGAGKSTLLKILSRITEPTKGKIQIKGRVASLLEVGTGFHPELTGRENIFLNGAILGMSKVEIKRKFDEIVAFAEVEKFLDTPVKRYSSGMYVRLAFAVAAHLEPEILVVDEVLAVGDTKFQKKCLGKMQEISRKEARTVIFVSHNMAAINSLCQNAILLNGGKLFFQGASQDATCKYMNFGIEQQKKHTVNFRRPSNLSLWIESITLFCNGMPSTQFYMGDTLDIDIIFASTEPIKYPIIGFVIYSSQGDAILNANNSYQKSKWKGSKLTKGKMTCKLGSVPFMEGTYTISFWLDSNGTQEHHYIDQALAFEVFEKDIWGNGRTPPKNVSSLWWPTDFQIQNAVDID